MEGRQTSSAFSVYTKVRKMSFNEFRKWLEGCAMAYFEEGLRTGEAEGAWWSDEQVYDVLRAEKIGPERARRIASRLAEGPEEEDI